ncbi:MAG: eIF2A-related protein [Nostoc sp. DedQUE01]|nr:TIR domain-containing protein [Nostoc sp. DedQUE01]
MSDVFISYSRRDKEFVVVLQDALKAHNRDTWVDWKDIPLTADWWAEIQAGIEATNTFVFVITPDSVVSKVCNQEIDHAVKNNKRLVPIVRREGFDMEQVNPALAKHNWLFFRQEDDFNTVFPKLIQAIDTNLEYVKAHTRLLLRALEWENKGRNDSFLLRGSDLQEAEHWLATSAAKEPLLTEQQKNYISKSREAEDAQQRLVQAGNKASQMVRIGSGILGVTLVLAVIAGVWAGKTIRTAEEKIQEAQEGTRLEQEGVAALQQFEIQSIEALLSAMLAGQDLQALVNDRPIEQYPAVSPILALQTILYGIREQTQLTGHQDSVRNASFSPDGKLIVTASNDKTARVWDTSTGKLLSELKGHQNSVNNASFSPDGKLIVTASDDNTARVWDTSTGKLLSELKGHQSAVINASFSPDGKLIVTESYDNTARVWDTSTGKLLSALKGHQSLVFDASFSPDGKLIVTTSYDNTARVWDTSIGKQVSELKGHQSLVSNASFSPDGKLILTASYDNTARVWDTSTGKLLSSLKGHENFVNNASFSPDGKLIVTASDDNTARVWDTSTGKLLSSLKGHQSSVSNASFFSPDGKLILTASDDNTARVWDTTTGKQLRELKGHQGFVFNASFSPDGKQIVTASADKTAGVWDTSTGKLLSELKGHQSPVINASFSPDGKLIVTTSYDNTARVWDISTGKLLREVKGYESSVNSASFSPDGKLIVTASADKTAGVWDTSTGKLLSELKGHKGSVSNASFSPDGKLIVTASADNTARMWDSTTGKLLSELKGHQSPVINASFSPDGKLIVTASADNTARVWAVKSLNQNLLVGCNWLRNYLVTHPKELEKLLVCQDKSILIPAAPFLVKEGEAEAREGDAQEALATFNTALKWSPSLNFNAKEKAEELAKAANLFKQGKELVEASNIDAAVTVFQSALKQDPYLETKTVAVLTQKGSKFIKESKFPEAISAYTKAQQLAPKVEIDAEFWNTLCRQGSLQKYAKNVMFACEKAVAFNSEYGSYRDSRGLARALTGNIQGAIEDFETYIAKTDDTQEKSQRQRWVKALRAGKDPSFIREEIK